MAMGKKHYESMAKAMRRIVDDHRDSAPIAMRAIGRCVIALADVLQADNPNFDKRRFYEACLKREV